VTKRWDGPYFYFEILDESLDKEIVEVTVTPTESTTGGTISGFF
jgi:hypothetical protein